ncbi:ABC transporter permease [Gemmobacter nectariphilus]|uniref:ABC transporter permease n=1 Tax=Gemmobacter nectariphilus TaxID=220343 RepID=UPI000427DEB3|nr:ABC transporter permease [Gemmobacter nectariphilus]
MRALNRKLLRDLRRIWPQSVAIALVLACGVAVLVMATGTLQSLSETRAAFYERQRFADVFATLTRAPKAIADEAAGIEGVAAVEAGIVLPAIVDLPGMTEAATARVMSLPEAGQPALNLPLLRSGRLPDPARPDEVALSEAFATASRLGPGEAIAITLSGQRHELRVTGLVLSPEYVYAIAPGSMTPDDRHFGLIWMNEAAMAESADLQGAFNTLALGLARGADERAVIAALDRLLSPYGGIGAHGRDRQTSHVFLDGELQQLGTIASLMPPVFLIVSAFLVNMVLGRLIGLERGQIGLLKAFGYSTRDVALHYIKMSAGIGVLGVALGLSLGWLAGHWMTALYGDYFRFPYLIYAPGAGPVVLSAVLGMATVTGGVLRAVLAAARLSPAEAMAPSPPPLFRQGWLDRLGHGAGLRQTTMMILRSIIRWPGRAAVTFFGVGASVSVLVACFYMFDVVAIFMDEVFVLSNRQDATLALSQPVNDVAIVDALALPGVRLAEGAFAVPVRLHSGPVSRTTTLQDFRPGAELTRLLTPEGQPATLPGDGLVLPDRLAERLGVRQGARVAVELLTGSRETWEVRVAAIIRQSLGEQAYMANDALFRLMRQPPQVNMLHLRIDPAGLPALHAQVKATPAIAGLTLWTDVKAEIDATMDRSMRVVTTIFSGLGMLIALGVVYNAARIQLSERAHELATLRVLGFSRREVGYVLVGEMMLLSVLSIPVGWLGGWGLAVLLHRGFSSDLVNLPFGITRHSYALAAVLVLGSALLAALWVRRGLDKVDLVMALKQRT